jgi:hypothetical protein
MVRGGLLLIVLTVFAGLLLSAAGTDPDLGLVVWTVGMFGGVALVIGGVAARLRRS